MEYVSFEAVVEPIAWGNATYTIVRLPDAIAKAVGPARRVEGEFNEYPVNLAITRAPGVNGPFLWSGKSLLEQAGIAPGVPFEARLRPADPNQVDLPPDLQTALRSAGKYDAWHTLTPGQRRRLIYQIDSAKRPETRIKRIQTALDSLA